MANFSNVRGDTFAFKFKVTYSDNTPVSQADISEILITFKANTRTDAKVIFYKSLQNITIDEDGFCHVVFEPKDTQSLNYGTYYFDCEITLNDGYRKTVLNTLTLTGETSIHTGA